MRHEPQRRVDFGLPGLYFLRPCRTPGKHALFLGVEMLVPAALNDKYWLRIHGDIPPFRRLHPVDFPATVFTVTHRLPPALSVKPCLCYGNRKFLNLAGPQAGPRPVQPLPYQRKPADTVKEARHRGRPLITGAQPFQHPRPGWQGNGISKCFVPNRIGAGYYLGLSSFVHFLPRPYVSPPIWIALEAFTFQRSEAAHLSADSDWMCAVK